MLLFLTILPHQLGQFISEREPIGGGINHSPTDSQMNFQHVPFSTNLENGKQLKTMIRIGAFLPQLYGLMVCRR